MPYALWPDSNMNVICHCRQRPKFIVILCAAPGMIYRNPEELQWRIINNNNNNRRLVTLAEHTSDYGKQTNSSTKEKGEQG